MCGIAGIIGESGDQWIDTDLVHRMCETLVHRGPDDEGVFAQNGVGLGMRRLSIIDLPGGHQPIFNEDRSIGVVFNGEIYNFRELRKDLERGGHRFRTQSDTETIVHLYEDYGAECVRKLRGMFAFALFDAPNRHCLLARDRLGKKPLHYALWRDRLFFGSEIKAILAVVPELSAVHSRALLDYFYFGYIPDPKTAFTAIQKLPPGHLLEFENGKLRVRCYWDLPEYGTYSPAGEEECLGELETRLSEAVKMRLIADVPLGALLSGGTDSSTVVAMIARATSRPVKTFCIGFRHADFNEAPFARKVAERFGTDHHELVLDPEVGETLDCLTKSLEEPFGDSSMLPTYFVSRLARKYVTVALSGDGGDEAFAGYDRYRLCLEDRSFNRIPNWARDFYRKNVYPRLPPGTPGRNWMYGISLPWAKRYVEAVSLEPMQRNFGLLSEDFLQQFHSEPGPLCAFTEIIDRSPAADPLSKILYLDTKTYLPGDILTKVDRTSMAASLEVRVPMLDHVFLEWVVSLAPRWKMSKNGQKYILMKLAERLGVPQEVVRRPKRGFAVPLLHWLRRELKGLVLELLLDQSTLQRGYFNGNGVRRLLQNFMLGRTNDYLEIWRLMMFELWHRNYLSQFSSQRQAHISDCTAIPEKV